jgi:hypothetical protein
MSGNAIHETESWSSRQFGQATVRYRHTGFLVSCLCRHAASCGRLLLLPLFLMFVCFLDLIPEDKSLKSSERYLKLITRTPSHNKEGYIYICVCGLLCHADPSLVAEASSSSCSFPRHDVTSRKRDPLLLIHASISPKLSKGGRE